MFLEQHIQTLTEAIEEIQETKMSSNFYVDASKNDLLRIINNQTTTIIKARNIFKEIESHVTMIENSKDRLAEAEVIIHHWKVFSDYLEKNPSVKEEWDALLMAIKLTEED